MKLTDIQNGSTRRINAHCRATDESHLWPICNRINVAERAIRRLRRAGLYNGGLEYYLALDAECTRIVNDAI